VRLSPGEWAVLAGLSQTNDSTNIAGIAGLARIPWLGHFFRNDTVTRTSDETLVVFKPRIVSLPPWDFPVGELEVGSDTKAISLY